MSAAVHAGLCESTPRMADGRGFDPVFRTLLGPQGMLHANFFVRSGYGGDLSTGAVDQEGAGSAGADVDSEPKHGSSQSSTRRRWD